MSFRNGIKAVLNALILSERIKPSQDAKRRAFKRYRLEDSVERFSTAVFYSILRNLGIYDRMIEDLTGVKNVYLLDETLRNALRLSLELLKNRELSNKQKKLIRRVLAGEIRVRSHPYASLFFWKVWDQLPEYELKPRNKEEEIMLKYGVSPFYARKLLELIPEEAENYLKAVNKAPPTVIRVNTLKSSPEEVERFLKERNILFEKSRRVEGVYRILSSIDLDKLPIFREGKILVQEEASVVAPLILDPRPGEKVLDLAAAPGGKTVVMAGLMKNKGKIYAVDVNEKRTERMREILRRTGVKNTEVIVEDGRNVPDIIKEVDKVLLDAPCTSSGTIQRNPEIRWRLREEDDILEFVSLQRELMEAAWKVLKPGGRMLYSTCSIFKEEDEDNVKWFLERHSDAKLVPLEGPYDEGFLPGTMRAWPHRHGTIGFFYALLEKGIK